MLKKLIVTAMAAGLIFSVSPQETEAASSKVKVKVSALNVRAKATVNSTKVGTVYKNQTLTYKGRVGAWKKVSYKGKTRYVYGAYVGSTSTSSKKTSVAPSSKGSYKMTMNTSAYTAFCAGCSGITASGVNVKNTTTYKGYKIIAAGRQFPIGTKMYIPGFGHALVQDRGGAIVGNKIDLLVRTNSQAYSWGRKNVTVTVYR